MKTQRTPFRDHTAESVLFIRRALIAFGVIVILTSILVTNLYHLQIVRHEDYQTRSNDNRIKLVPIAPSRGIIYDRQGTQLALNSTFYQLEIVPEKVDNLQETLDKLRDIVDLTDEDIANFEKERKRSRRFTSIALKTQLNEVQVARFAVNQYHFPGLEVKSYQRRSYPYGSALTHVIGYVAKINDKDIERLDKDGLLPNYAASHDIGKLGIERYYESVLHGKTGYEEVEVNSRGRVIRQLHEQPPQAGRDIYLTIDLELQIYIEKLLTTSRAAVVVTDPRNGEILALVSNPSYDSNLFVNGISNKDYQALLNNPDRPLINRTTQGLYPPASTVKPFISVAALSEKVITPNTTIFDPGWWQLPGSEKRYRDWKRWGHGKLNVMKSIIESADTFFYQVAYDMGIDRLSVWMTRFGFGEYTGIDLAEERSGIMPTREWKQKRYKKPWYQGDTIPVGIGQGYWTATPIQMSKALMTLINDGQVKTPHLLYGTKLGNAMVPYEDKETTQIGDIHSGYWELAKQGMYGVANAPNGTGRRSFIGTPYKAAAKSGTAQVFSYETYNASKLAEHLRDHKLMIAYAPYDKPTIAVTIILENGGAGPSVGDIVRQIFDHVLLGDNRTEIATSPTSAGEDR
ncbi:MULTISPECIES: peptidoglycan DD-transpeptidase MrdA [Providencia]|uniref:Peptidoglycan D,D-transpeptidase MrdA n=4 Tax=Providencia TaxID=586 RepID=A0AA42FN74_9GAMM|nr:MULTISPECIES: peptidoglycan DD-transpeptidase MrdA [Providencia]MBC8654270.1 peptidoglycan DD-transpeptidase MrdA [Providencia vermicola]HCI97731.1 penicillin-binding protein 2 [Providencia sp.]APC10751.1 Stage V sporulation protein D [Providencia rettgeri]AVL74319.1 penicillin-binding protein 2 [Providencia rettgeri]EIL1981884.1 peptidoglycan DD-transpeptidase MrdA [Providencia rettgeri]